MAALRSAFRDTARDIAVEIRGRKQEFRRRALRQVCDSCGHDVAAPGVFDGQRDAERDA